MVDVELKAIKQTLVATDIYTSAQVETFNEVALRESLYRVCIIAHLAREMADQRELKIRTKKVDQIEENLAKLKLNPSEKEYYKKLFDRFFMGAIY